MTTLIGIQDKYIQTILAGANKWSHRPGRRPGLPGGHFTRIARGAHTKAVADLATIGYTGEAAEKAIADAWDMAKLELGAE